MDHKISKSNLIGMFKRAKLVQDEFVAVSTWDGIMELAILVPAKHFDDYINLLIDCYDDNLNPISGAPANTPEICDAVSGCFNMLRSKREMTK